MDNFSEKPNALKKAEIILKECNERENISKQKIKKAMTNKNELNEYTEKRVKEIYKKQNKKIKFWKNFSLIVMALLIVSLFI